MDTNASTRAGLQSNDVIDGRYRVLKTVGEGGMGTVYLAEHTLIKRRVAVKVLHPELASDGKVVERFMNEARAAGTLGHPNIVESTDMGFMDGAVPYIVFEYLEGSLLTDEIYRLGAMPVRRAVKISQQIASALHAAHAAGIVHRDLKTDNIFLTDRDELLDHVKVLDFGISKFLEAGDEKTRRGMIMGTPEFMAPEQITNPDLVDARCDVYALGVILYEMLAGRRPFTNEDPRTLLHRIVHTEAPPIDRAEVPRGLHDLVFKLLEKEPGERFQTMADVEAVLDLYATQGESGPIRRSSSRLIAQRPLVEPTHPDLMGPPRGRAPTPVPARGSQAMLIDSRESQANMRVDTPWPMPERTATIPPQPKNQWLLYGLVAVGVAIGGIGLYIGLRRPEPAQVAQAPQPAPTPPPPAASIPTPAPQKVEVKIEADVPNARVVFRRRVAAAPATMEVSATDIVELVEVSAPGRQTVRYWLTIDRDTHLTAKLPKGQGMREATEEDTLVALGEAELITGKAPSETARVKPAAAAATTVAKVEPTKADPATKKSGDAPVKAARKIGKAAASEESKADANTSDTALAAAPEPKKSVSMPDWMEEPKAAPGKPAAPAKAPPPETKVEAAAAANPGTAPATAKTAPTTDAGAKPATPKPAGPAVVEKNIVNNVANKNRTAVISCYDQGRKLNDRLRGEVTVSMQVEPSGAISRPQIKSTLGNPTVAGCILVSVRKWKFPPRTAAAQASYKFVLE